MPNWENIRKLRDHLKSLRITKYRKFNMSGWIEILSGKEVGDTVTIAELRKNGPECGSAACLFGEAVIALAEEPDMYFETFRGDRRPALNGCAYLPQGMYWKSVHGQAKELLGLNIDEADFMSMGRWLISDEKMDNETWRKAASKITRDQAVRYLDKVLRTKKIMVTITKTVSS